MLLLIFGDHADPFSMTGNAGLYLDKYLFGDSHLYHGEGIAFDPEGLLSTLPAIVNVTIGYYTGLFIQKKGQNYETIAKLLLWGSFFILIALTWNMAFPINKKLWTSSFVLLTCGNDLMILALLIYITAIRYPGDHKWTIFFSVFGKNPLFIYVLSEILVILFYLVTISNDSLYHYLNAHIFQRILPGAIGSLSFAIFFMLICWSIGRILDRKKIYIRV
ncbi:acyltransferase family protein [Arcticibacter sp. MXS-1]|uniref:acyltransferase family protein n=1 Tax=Arcticibacter sp. MXS-1 TaxID=3341726 RepID=UPI0035A85F2E